MNTIKQGMSPKSDCPCQRCGVAGHDAAIFQPLTGGVAATYSALHCSHTDGPAFLLGSLTAGLPSLDKSHRSRGLVTSPRVRWRSAELSSGALHEDTLAPVRDHCLKPPTSRI